MGPIELSAHCEWSSKLASRLSRFEDKKYQGVSIEEHVESPVPGARQLSKSLGTPRDVTVMIERSGRTVAVFGSSCL